MAAEVRAELRLRDGQRRAVHVRVQPRDQTGTGTGTLVIGSLITAVRELSHDVTCLLTELVQREQGQCACATELDEEDEDEDEEDPSDSEPEPKRSKP